MANVKSYQMLIDGKWVNASNGAMFESINPTNGQVWSKVPEATETDVDDAVNACTPCFFDWSLVKNDSDRTWKMSTKIR